MVILVLASTAFAQRSLKTYEDLRGVHQVSAVLSLGSVDLKIRKVEDPSKAFTIRYAYSEDEKVPKLTYVVDGDRGMLLLSNEKGGDHVSLWNFHEEKDSVLLELATEVPLSLKANFGVCDADVDLGGMKVTDAVFSTGVCSFTLDFSSPNRVSCEDLRIKTGISSIVVNNLANARASHIELEGGVGSIKVDFGGKLSSDCEVRIKSGLGSVDISIPEDINTTIRTPESFLTGVDVAGFYSEGGGVYRSKVRTGPQLKIKIDSGLGGVDVKSY